MYNTLQSAHSIFAYIVLLALVLASANAILGVTQKKRFTDKDLRISLFAFILTHFQLLIGLILYFVSPSGSKLLGNMEKTARLTSLEHPLMNIIAIALITIGWSKHKKEASDNGKFKKIALFYTIGTLFILSRIPWNLWMN